MNNYTVIDPEDYAFLEVDEIEAIRSDTFLDLVKGSPISLSGSGIKSMNGLLYQNLSRLSRVNLEGNECIDENIEDKDPLQRSAAQIDRQCRYIKSTTT